MLFTVAGHTAALADDPTADEPAVISVSSSSATGPAMTLTPNAVLGFEYRADNPERQRGGIAIGELPPLPKPK
jgi:hypothetical protein